MRLVVHLPDHTEDHEKNRTDDESVVLDYSEPFPLSVEVRVARCASGLYQILERGSVWLVTYDS